MKKLVIAAGTGFLGKVLIAYFKDKTDEIVILTRKPLPNNGNIRYVQWDAKTLTGWETELNSADALINLAGKSVNCRYTITNKNEILNSRVDSTAILGKAIAQCTHPPKHWLNASTATIYRHSEDKQMNENEGEIGSDFSMNVAKMWERIFFGINTPQTYKTALRTSIVLGNNGGAFPIMKKLAMAGLGGKQGNGRQYISWIHENDFARAVAFIVTEKLIGPVNVTAPNPIKNKDFMSALRKAVHIPFGIPQPEWLLKIGATVIGTETELVLKSRNVIPVRLQKSGFNFQHSTAIEATNALV
ncbi:TIGR01777 family oxidoreductase [Flavobacterium sp. RNTU_13]|uniref:TIGR01777 family oxidoreductase n=1 Tax=Flavobacterium sp. RNTU_13 TaxID=3375145 RepID=UPI003987926C